MCVFMNYKIFKIGLSWLRTRIYVQYIGVNEHGVQYLRAIFLYEFKLDHNASPFHINLTQQIIICLNIIVIFKEINMFLNNEDALKKPLNSLSL